MITVATYKVELAEQLDTIKAFIRRSIPIRITPYTQDKAAQTLVDRHQYSVFPVVYCTNADGDVCHSWSGYDPAQINQAIENHYHW